MIVWVVGLFLGKKYCIGQEYQVNMVHTTIMFALGSGGVHIWDLRMRRCLHKFKDEGALRCTSMALCPSSRYFAAGSEVGVVNIYDHNSCSAKSKQAQPSPIRAVTNLTTAINILEFNPDSQVRHVLLIWSYSSEE